MKKIIFIDRDGTLIFDKKYHLGKTVEGIKLLQKIKNKKVFFAKDLVHAAKIIKKI